MGRPKHTEKEVEDALRFAEQHGWHVRYPAGHLGCSVLPRVVTSGVSTLCQRDSVKWLKRSSADPALCTAMHTHEDLKSMNTHSFEMHFDTSVSDLDSTDGVALLDALVANGLNDASIAQIDGKLFAIVDREAETLVDAIMTALLQIESLEYCSVLRVLPQDLMSATEIARRYGKSRQWVYQLVSGKRGAGDFPTAFALDGAAAHWRSSDIENYFADAPTPTAEEVRSESAFLETLNAALDFRNRSRKLSALARDEDTRRVVSAVLQDTLAQSA